MDIMLLKSSSEEKNRKREMERTVKIIITDLSECIKEIGFNDGRIIKNSKYI